MITHTHTRSNMFNLSVKDLACDMTYLTTTSLSDAKKELALKYNKDDGCIVLFDLSNGKIITKEIIDADLECGVYISSYSKEDKDLFEKFAYNTGGTMVFYLALSYNPEPVEKENLSAVIHKLPELFEWAHHHNVISFIFETRDNEWYKTNDSMDAIFDTLVQCLSENSTFKHVNLNLFQNYLFTHPEQRKKLQEMLNRHQNLDVIFLKTRSQTHDKVDKLKKAVSKK